MSAGGFGLVSNISEEPSSGPLSRPGPGPSFKTKTGGIPKPENRDLLPRFLFFI